MSKKAGQRIRRLPAGTRPAGGAADYATGSNGRNGENPMNIYTLGYSGWRIEDIEAEIDRLDAILADVRMVPRSRVPQWNGATFARRLGDRYVWLREFGNQDYKGSTIQIVDLAGGEAKLKTFDSRFKAVILLCGCRDVAVCHRKVVAEWLAQRWGGDVVHLAAPGPSPSTQERVGPSQPTLF